MDAKAIFGIIDWAPARDKETREDVNSSMIDEFLYPIRFLFYAMGFGSLWGIVYPLAGVYIIIPIAIFASFLLCWDLEKNEIPLTAAGLNAVDIVSILVSRIFQCFFHATWPIGFLGILGGID